MRCTTIDSFASVHVSGCLQHKLHQLELQILPATFCHPIKLPVASVPALSQGPLAQATGTMPPPNIVFYGVMALAIPAWIVVLGGVGAVTKVISAGRFEHLPLCWSMPIMMVPDQLIRFRAPRRRPHNLDDCVSWDRNQISWLFVRMGQFLTALLWVWQPVS